MKESSKHITPNRKTPNFICLGAQKPGTTTLHDILKQYPEIFLPKDKEAPFLIVSEAYDKGVGWWLNHYFSDYNNESILGVMTPEYLYYEEVPNRILESCGPDVKLIIILRQPLDRAYSLRVCRLWVWPETIRSTLGAAAVAGPVGGRMASKQDAVGQFPAWRFHVRFGRILSTDFNWFCLTSILYMREILSRSNGRLNCENVH